MTKTISLRPVGATRAGTRPVPGPVTLSREEATLIVRALDAHVPAARLGCIIVDDPKIGSIAEGVHPDDMDGALRLVEPRHGLADRAPIRESLAYARDAGRTLRVDTGDGMSWIEGPSLSVSEVASDEPSVTWESDHAARALHAIGVHRRGPIPERLSARDILDGCETLLDKVTDPDAIRLYEIADFAITNGGPDAYVSAR